MFRKYLDIICNYKNSFFEKKKNDFLKVKNFLNVIWKDPLQRYIFLFLVSFIFAILTFFILFFNKNHIKFTAQGKVRFIKSGDTFILGEKTIKLYGIDAPELEQKCEYYNVYTKKFAEYSCGLNAKEYLSKLIKSQALKCKVKDEDEDDTLISICYVRKFDKINRKYIKDFEVNKAVVRNGYAIAYKSRDYVKDEYFAKKFKKGIWNSDFIKPEKYRKKHNNN